jgi:hypothetical protein
MTKKAVVLKDLDPRQAMARALYTDPKSETFANLKQSMIKAGYDSEYSNNVYCRKPLWLTQGLKDQVELINNAEKNLRKYAKLEIDTSDRSKGNIDFAKIQVDVTKFVLKNLANGKYNSNDEGNDKANIKIVINKLLGDNKVHEVEVVPNAIEALDNYGNTL